MLASYHRLDCGGKSLDLSTPKVMGVINLSSNSFSAIGRCHNADEAYDLAKAMVDAGVGLIDVGAEPTNPYVEPVVSLQAQMDKVLPVIARLSQLPVPISLDTSEPALILAASKLGLGFVNDVRAFSRPGALSAVAKTGLPVCLMHMTYPDGSADSAYKRDRLSASMMLDEIIKFLAARVQVCVQAGILRSQIIVDPGLGGGNFGKTPQENCYLLARLSALKALGQPILVGASRKTLVYRTLGVTIEESLAGSLAAASLAVANGASIIRAHDVAQTVQAVNMVAAVFNAAAVEEETSCEE